MQHSSLIDKGDPYSILNISSIDDDTFKMYKWDGTNLSDISSSATISDLGNGYKKATTTSDGEDYFVFINWDGLVELGVVGEPDAYMIIYAGETSLSLTYKQFDPDGSELDSGDASEIGYGWYYIYPSKLQKSYFEIKDADGNVLGVKILKLPYKVMNVSDCPGQADKNFINVGYNMFGFQGNRYSYYDLDSGKWINDDNREAKASDLAKAVCSKYTLVWDDKNDDNWIGNYIKYIRSYDENAKKYRYYKPYITPESNDANFPLVQTDEDDNEWIRGVSMFLKQNLETISNTDGAIVTFKEE